MEIDIDAEVTKLTQEVQSLALQLQELEKKSQAIKNEIVKRQGAVGTLQALKANRKLGKGG